MQHLQHATSLHIYISIILPEKPSEHSLELFVVSDKQLHLHLVSFILLFSSGIDKPSIAL